MKMRKRIFEIIFASTGEDKFSTIYDITMMIAIIISIIPLAFKTTNILFIWIDYITVFIFIIDYVLRAFKLLRYSKRFKIIINVFKVQKNVLGAVATMAVAYVIVSALVIYNVEPDSFNTFFDAIYWATISLTTVGYGEIIFVKGESDIFLKF